jgi:hypothetical protein
LGAVRRPSSAIPDSFIESDVQRPTALMGNQREPVFVVPDGFGSALGEPMKQRITHVLSERYPENK